MVVERRRELAKKLESIAWSMLPSHGGLFPQYHTAWHPAIPRRILETVPLRPRANIADPFCGGGVTLVEALMLGHCAIGRDTNPFAVRMARVRTRALEPAMLADAIRQWKDAYHSTPMPDPDEREDAKPHFETRAIQTLLRAEHAWRAVAPDLPEWNEWFSIALSPSIRALSVYAPRTPKRMYRKQPVSETTYQRFPIVMQRRMQAMAQHNLMLATLAPEAPPPNIQILDCAALPRELDAIITSPPYGISYRYEDVYTPQLAWLRLEPPLLITPPPTPEWWPRPVRDWYAYFQHTTPAPPYQHRAYAEYIELLGRLAHTAMALLRPNGVIAVAIGDTILQRTPLPNTQILEHWLQHCGLKPITRIERRLPYTRIPTRRNPATGRFDSQAPPRESTETLLFYSL